MNTLSKSLLALALVAVLSAPASAQQRRGGGMMGGRGMGVAMLLSNKSVQDELKVDDAQKAKLAAIGDKVRSATEGLEGPERMTKMREMEGSVVKEAGEVLKPEQVARLHEIRYQVAGAGAFGMEEVQKKLNITSEQKSAIDEVLSSSAEEMREIFQNSNGDRQAAMAKMTEHRKATVAKVEAKLTEEQKADYAKLVGAPFELKMEGRGPGGR